MQELNSEHAFFNGLPSHEIANFDITCINTVVKGQSSSGWTLDRRISTGREFFCLGFVLSGGGIYQFENHSDCHVEKYDILFLNKGERYFAKNGKKEAYSYIVVDFDCTNETFLKSLFHSSKITVRNSMQYEAIFSLLEKEWKKRSPIRLLKAKSILFEILYRIMSQKLFENYPQKKLTKISPALQYLHDHYTDSVVNVDYLSQLCGFSVVHFRRLFREIYNMSPNEYIQQLRLERAKDLLNSGFFTVSEVAEQCGFSNVYYFSRFFKKHAGIPPSDYSTG